MGVDLICVINHNFNKKELLELPSRIDNWSEIRNLLLNELPKTYSKKYIDENYSNLTKSYFKKDLSEVKTEFKLDENYLELVWSQWENNFEVALFALKIITYFAFIVVNRKTIIIEQMPWHKYSNLDDKDMAKMILELNRIIAKKLNQNKMVYFPDSAYPTSILNNFAYEGKTVEEIIEIGDSTFSYRPIEIEEGIQFKYFVDDLSDDLSNLTDLSNSEKYWKWNTELNNYERINTPHNSVHDEHAG